MKKPLLALLALAGLSVFGQDKTVELKPSDKHKLVGWEQTSNGMFYLVTGKSKSDVSIKSYDQDLNLVYEKNMDTQYEGLPAFFGRGMNDLPKYYDMYASKTGAYAMLEDERMFIDRSGKTTKFNYAKKEECPEIEMAFTFLSDDYVGYLGNKPEKGKGKKKVVDNNMYLFRRSVSDQSTRLIALSVPTIETTDEKLLFGLHSYDKDGFYIINKQLDKEKAIDIYHIMNYDYEGKLLSHKTLNIKLDGKYFAASDCGFGSSTIIFGPMSTSHHLSDNATGNVYIDKAKGEYYVFGVYTDHKDMNLYNAKNNGFYVKKFDSDGKLIWESMNEIKDKDYNKNAVSYFTEMSFFKLDDSKVGVRISNSRHNYAHLFLLNNTDGKAIKNKKNDFSVSNIELNGIRGTSFPTGYTNKDEFGKNSLNVDTFFAAFASEKVARFFDSVKDMKNNYKCWILEGGIYVLEENRDTETFRLMKFNW